MQELVADIPDLIAHLRDADPTFKVFGSKNHQYRLGPPLDLPDLIAFESEKGCKLPADYREYLLTVSDGSAGPYYGLESLKTASQYRTLSKPFPFTVPTDTLADAQLEEHGDRDDYGGILELCHHGCAIYTYLVVSGPTYGTMWDGREDFYPLGIHFASWYCRWANRALTCLANERLVTQIKLGMTTTEVDGTVGGDWKARKTSSKTLYESPTIPAQLELNEKGVVGKINPWPFI